MDGGTYNNVVRTNSPFSPASATTPNAYKANVNRTKTRKWVEARQNNYDGDDWGNDFDDDDEEDEAAAPPPVQRVPTGGLLSSVRSVSTPLQARDLEANDAFGRRSFGDPGTNTAPSQQPGNIASPTGARNDPFPPANRIQPVYAANKHSDMQSPQGPASQPFASHTRTDSLQAGTSFPPRKSSMSNAASGDSVPSYVVQPENGTGSQVVESQPTYTLPTGLQEASPPAGKAKKFVRPSDIYKRVEEAKEKERLSMDSSRPSLDGITGRGSGASSPTMLRTSGEQRRRASLDRSDVGDAGIHGEKSTLPTVAETKSELGLNKSAGGQTSTKGGSISPQLPEVSRMSMFGDDFFSNRTRETSPPVPTQIVPIEESKPLETAEEKVVPDIASPSSKLPEASQADKVRQEDTSAEAAPPAKKTGLGHLARPSLPGGWVSETTNVESATPTPMENPLETAQYESDMPPPTTAPENTISKGHPTPQSLPPLNTQGGPAPTKNILQEQQGAKSAASEQAPNSYTGQESPASYAPSSAAASIPSYGDNVPPLGPPRKSTLSSVATASPLKESDMLSDEIMKSLSPAVDASGNPSRAGPSKLSSQDIPEDHHLSRSLSGIYDDYYGFQEDKTLGDGGQILKTDTQTSQDTSKLVAQPVSSSAVQKGGALPEIRPLSPNKKGTELQAAAIQGRERRFSFDAGPENVTLSPVDAPDSSAVSFGSMEDRQKAAQPEYKEAPKPAASPAPARETTPVPGPSASQLQPQNQTITHQVSQMSIGVTDDIDLNQIDQPSPISTAKSVTPVGSPQIPLEDKVLVQPDVQDVKASELSSAPDADVSSIISSHKTDLPALAAAETVTAPAATNPTQKIMPFREILVIGSPQQRIQKFDETRSQFFNMDTGLGDWLHHMQLQSDPSAAGSREAGPGANEVALPTIGQPAQQPYYQQYLNASNPSLNMPPPNRSNTGGLASPIGGQGSTQGLPNSGFNTGTAGVKGKELLQAAGVLGNKGMKTGMKFFSKSKTKLRERGDKVFN